MSKEEILRWPKSEHSNVPRANTYGKNPLEQEGANSALNAAVRTFIGSTITQDQAEAQAPDGAATEEPEQKVMVISAVPSSKKCAKRL